MSKERMRWQPDMIHLIVLACPAKVHNEALQPDLYTIPRPSFAELCRAVSYLPYLTVPVKIQTTAGPLRSYLGISSFTSNHHTKSELS